MSETLTEKLTKTKEGMRLYQQERAILDVTELVCKVMDEQHVNRSELARRIGKTKGYITQLLDGRTNMTVRTIADVFTALGRAVYFQEGPLEASVNAAPFLSLELEPAWVEQERPWSDTVVITGGPHAAKVQLAG